MKTLAWATATFSLFTYAQAYALSLGEIQVLSRLGQPFDALIRVTGVTGENLQARCFRVIDSGDAALPQVADVRLSLSNRLSPAALQIRSLRPLREPMSELVIKVECPGAPQFQRTYMVLLDPPSDADLRPPASATGSSAVRNDASVNDAAPDSARVMAPVAAPVRVVANAAPRLQLRQRYVGPNDPVTPNSVYVVRPGDVLSMIALRIIGRNGKSIWPAADRIVADNPAAFIDGNPDLLIVGAELNIPGLWAFDASASRARLAALAAERLRGSGLDTPVNASSVVESVGTISTVATTASTPPLRAMVLSRRFGAVSRERLTLRREGRLQVSSAALDGATPDTPPVPQPGTPEPAAPAPAQALPATRSAPQAVQIVRRGGLFGWLGLLIGLLLGALAAALGLRRWAQRNADERMQEFIRAQRHQERLEESRQQRSSTDAPSIVVQEDDTQKAEQASPPASEARTLFAIDPMASSGGGMALADPLPEPTTSTASSDTQRVSDDDDDTNSIDFPGPGGLSLQTTAELTGAFEAPDEFDLELLARDYAQSITGIDKDLHKSVNDSDDTSPMLHHEELGITGSTQIMDKSLDLELPDEASANAAEDTADMAGEADDHEDAFNPNTLEQELLALDYGLEQTGEDEDDGYVAEVAGNDTSTLPGPDESMIAPLTLENIDDNGDILDGGRTKRDNSTPHTQQEEYYHLEASSVMDVGDLTFDTDANDDESKILEFRKRPGRTGTDDSNSSE